MSEYYELIRNLLEADFARRNRLRFENRASRRRGYLIGLAGSLSAWGMRGIALALMLAAPFWIVGCWVWKAWG